ncbi:MAG: hypothetical protein JXM73_09855 [Anaerolineae bacterium]|nr:hypothetical protein [Anaerolineae bacterium]
MNQTVDVIGLGWVMVDYLVVLPTYPRANTKTEVLVGLQQVGGPVARAMITLSRLGKWTGLIAKVGDDQRAVLIRDMLQKEKVEFGAAEAESGQESRYSHVWIDEKTGNRTVAYWRGRLKDLQWSPEAQERLQQARILHLDGREFETALAAAKLAREIGCRVVLDAGNVKPGIDQLIPLVDVVIAPSVFASKFLPGASPQKVGKSLLAMGAQWVVLTFGSRGSIGISKDGMFRQPSFPVKMVDTNGAGDTFSGGLLYGLLEGWGFEKSVRFANAVAALKCAKLGNRGLPNFDEVQEFLESSSDVE